MNRIIQRLLTVYLDLFAGFSADPARARSELALVIGSVEYMRLAGEAAGLGATRALLRSVRSHLGELQPLAVIAKLRADSAAFDAHRAPARSREGIVAVLLGFTVVGVVLSPLFAAWALALSMLVWSIWLAGRLIVDGRTGWLIMVTLVLVMWPLLGVRAGVAGVLLAVAILALGLAVTGRMRADRPFSRQLGFLFALMPGVYAVPAFSGNVLIAALPEIHPAEVQLGMHWGEWLAVVRNLQLVAYWGLVAVVLSLARTQMTSSRVSTEQ